MKNTNLILKKIIINGDGPATRTGLNMNRGHLRLTLEMRRDKVGNKYAPK